MKRVVQLAAVTAAAALVLSACGDAPEDDATTGAGGATEASSDFKACMVSDEGGFDDKSFNESGFNGLKAAEEALGIEVTTQESQTEADFAPNIDNLIASNCNIVVTSITFNATDGNQIDAISGRFTAELFADGRTESYVVSNGAFNWTRPGQ